MFKSILFLAVMMSQLIAHAGDIVPAATVSIREGRVNSEIDEGRHIFISGNYYCTSIHSLEPSERILAVAKANNEKVEVESDVCKINKVWASAPAKDPRDAQIAKLKKDLAACQAQQSSGAVNNQDLKKLEGNAPSANKQDSTSGVKAK